MNKLKIEFSKEGFVIIDGIKTIITKEDWMLYHPNQEVKPIIQDKPINQEVKPIQDKSIQEVKPIQDKPINQEVKPIQDKPKWYGKGKRKNKKIR